MTTAAAPPLGPRPMQFFGGWEAGLVVMMMLLYLAGAFINPNFFGSADAFQALLRDSARYAVMAVGMTFVIANKDLDLSVGSTFGLVTVVFAYAFNPAHYDMGVGVAIVACFVLGTVIGLINGVLVTILRVPAFIATLTMLFIGRGFVLGLTGGQIDPLSGQGARVPLVLPARRVQRLGLQQPDPDRARRRRARRLRARQDALGLRDLRDRRQRAGGDLCRHPDALGQDTRLPARIVVRHDRRPDGGRAGQGHSPQSGLERRADRHRRGHHRRRLDPRRPRPRPRQLPRRGARRPDQQGAARGLADHPHAHRRRPGSAGARRCSRCRPARSRPSSACS